MRRVVIAPVLLALVTLACDPAAGPLPAGDDDLAYASYGQALSAALRPDPDGQGFVTLPLVNLGVEGFDRVGLMYDAEPGTAVEVRVSYDGGHAWSDWAPLVVTWRDGDAHVGHADVEPGATHAQLRFGADRAEDVSYLTAELFTYRPDLLMVGPAGELPTQPPGGTGVATDYLAADGVAVSRSSWGARSSRCTSSHTASRVTVHHTVTPNDDSWDMPRRVRQIQAYHMDSRGWCDVGYHFLIGQDGKVYQGRVETKVGAHVAGHNTSNLGVSFIGDYSAVTPSSGMFSAAARILKSISRTYGIALNRTKIKAHREYAATACPGARLYAKLDYLVSLAQGSTGGTPSKGFLKGAVFFGSDFSTDINDASKRISGATVKLSSGQTATTDGSGYYTFEVAPGTYTVTASKSGYSTESASKTVSAGATTWGSLMLTPQNTTAKGTVKGFVFWGTDYDRDKSDTSKRIAGATVTFSPGGRTVTTDGSGFYEIELAPGSYEVHAAAPGYVENDRPDPVGVTAGAVAWGSVMLTKPTQTVDDTPPAIVISAPSAGAVVDLPTVQVVGNVSDQSPIDRFVVDGADAALQNGGFSVAVTLVAGENTLHLEATDRAGNTGTADVSVTYAPPPSGVAGFVFDASADATARIEGALVVIETMEERYEAVTDATGAFSVDGAPGTWSLTVTADGFLRHVGPVEVPEGTRRQLEIGLQPGADGPAIVSPVVEITYPLPGEVVSEPEVVVAGSAGVEDLAEVTIDGETAALDAESRTFSGVVRLEPGFNDIEVIALRGDGSEAASATVTVEHIPAARAGCSVGGTGGRDGAGVALLLALAVALRRRRRR